jgi:toxin CcdB
MGQFDVFRNPRGGVFPFLVDVQADLLSDLATRVVVPLAPAARWESKPLTRLNPIMRIRGVDHVLVFQELAAIPRSALKPAVGSLRTHRDEIIAALDLLFTGI